MVSVADNFYGMARMGFRVEDGQEVLYYTISNGTSIRRANLTLRQDTLFLQGAAAQSGLGNFNSALALRSGDYAPFGGELDRDGRQSRAHRIQAGQSCITQLR